MEFFVSLDKFEGPLDLMLHLIKEKELDLFHLDVNVLCDQYVAYIKKAEELQLEIAGEYLSELAGLLELKSKTLLPQKVSAVEEEVDDRDALVKRLIEYQRFKDVAEVLNSYQQERSRMLSKPLSMVDLPQEMEMDNSLLVGNPYDLMKAMNRCLRHVALQTPREAFYHPKEYSVTEVAEELTEKYGKQEDSVALSKMMLESGSLMKAIAVFLAVLDLIHQKRVDFSITSDEEVYLKWSDTDES